MMRSFGEFVKSGAIGSHLENLQRKGGFKVSISTPSASLSRDRSAEAAGALRLVMPCHVEQGRDIAC
jgi:hypothetical protein